MFKKHYQFLLAFLLVISSSVVWAIPGTTCGSTSSTLYAGQHINAGTVTVANDADYLYVRYQLTDPAGVIDATHLWIGSQTQFDALNSNRPHSGKNREAAAWYGQATQSGPDAGWFDAGGEYFGGTNWAEYKIALTSLAVSTAATCDGDAASLIIVPHAAIGSGIGIDKDGLPTSVGGETAFAGGEVKNPEDKGGWYYYFDYEIAACCPVGPVDPVGQACETAFAKGTTLADHVILAAEKTVGNGKRQRVLNNPDDLESRDLKVGRWGWEVLYDATNGFKTYQLWAGAGLNDTSKAINVGTATVSPSGSGVMVTYTITKTGLFFEELHVNVSANGTDTAAPGQYTVVEDLEVVGDQTRYTVDIQPSIDPATGLLAWNASTAPVWIVMHAAVCGFD